MREVLSSPPPDFNNITIKQLKEIIRIRGLKGYSRMRKKELISLLQNDMKIRWRRSGKVVGSKIHQFDFATHKTKIDEVEIVDFLDHTVPDDHEYFISPNAARGIIRRVTNSDRKLFEPMDKALRILSNKPN